MTQSVRLLSTSLPVAVGFATRLEKQGFGPVTVDIKPTTTFCLRRRTGVPMSDVTRLMAAIAPAVPSQFEELNATETVDFEISLGDASLLDTGTIVLHVDSQTYGLTLRENLEKLGLKISNVEVHPVESACVKHGGVSALAKAIVAYALEQDGVQADFSKDWGDDDKDIWIFVPDPALVGKPAKEVRTVSVQTDELAAGQILVDRLNAQGFRAILSPLEQECRFSVDPGVFDRRVMRLRGTAKMDADAAAICQITEEFMQEQAVELSRYPLEREHSRKTVNACVRLPLKAARSGILGPYAGPLHERFAVVICDNDDFRAEKLANRFRGEGFVRVQTEKLAPDEFLSYLAIESGEAIPGIPQTLRATLDAELAESGCAPLPLVSRITQKYSIRLVVVDDKTTPITTAARQAEMGRVNVQLLPANGIDIAPLKVELERIGLSVKTGRPRPRPRPGEPGATIHCGGAKPAVLAAISRCLEPYLPCTPVFEQIWGEEDKDVFIHVTSTVALPSPPDADLHHTLRFQHWLAPANVTPATFIEAISDRFLRVGETVLPLHHSEHQSLIPRNSFFSHFCIDQRTAETLAHLAQSVLLEEACLLEGETSTSKTSSILYLAAQLGQPVVRLNLNGQTDTSELLGRYSPAEGTSAEGGPHWRWKDGLLLQALRLGWWVILDEINLAEPQILERLNPLLERTASLLISEHEGEVYGAEGIAIHPQFRLFATMNPCDYEGRSTLSPAYRDRWRGYRFVPAPGESEYVAMLRYECSGVSPSVMVQGCHYTTSTLRTQRDMPAHTATMVNTTWVEPLARFHASVVRACSDTTNGVRLGAQRREPYVFTRRTLLSIVDMIRKLNPVSDMDHTRVLRLAVQRYYLDRVMEGQDRDTMIQLLDAVGLGPSLTKPESVPKPSAALEDTEVLADFSALFDDKVAF